MSQKFLDLAGLTAYDRMLKEWFKAGVVDITNDAINALFPVVQPNNEIWYTSSDGNVVSPYESPYVESMFYEFGANIISNTYENGKGVIKFDDLVTGIGFEVFLDCKSITSIVIPNSVTYIDHNAFVRCSSLTSIVIPDSVTSIGGSAFQECSSLTSVIIGKSVTSIGMSAFSHCTNLTSVSIPDSVTSIDNNAFKGCSSLTSPLYNTHCFAYMPTSYSGAYTIPEGIKQIAGGAFDGCSGLTSVTIPDSVTSIGSWAFYECEILTSITFEGTIDQWNSIDKGNNWNKNVPATYVQCTDGQVAL